jgi:glutathione S-transferase
METDNSLKGMIVYGSSVSPFVRKALAFAAEKGLEIKVKGVTLNSADPEFREASPFAKMPALRHGDYLLADSSAIVAYMDAVKHDPVLIPADARERGKTIWWDEFADTILIGAAVKVFFNRVVAPRFLGQEGDLAVADRAVEKDLPPLFAYLEHCLPPSGWLVGDRLTLADISVVSPFANLRYAGCEVDAAAYPKLSAFIAKMFRRPSFERSLAHEAKVLAG